MRNLITTSNKLEGDGLGGGGVFTSAVSEDGPVFTLALPPHKWSLSEMPGQDLKHS